MGVGTAAARHKAHDEILIELNRFTWRQVVGTDDYRVVNLGCPIEIALHEGAQDLSHNIVDVGSTGFHVFIVHGFQHGSKLLPCPFHCAFCRQMVIRHEPFDHVHKIRVLEHHLMGFKDASFLFTDFLSSFLGKFAQLGNHFFLGRMEAAQFRLGIKARKKGHTIFIGSVWFGRNRSHSHTAGSGLSFDDNHRHLLEIFLKEGFQGAGGFLFVFPFNRNGNRHTSFDAKAHDGKDAFKVAGLSIAFHLAGRLEASGGLDQKSRRTSMDTRRIRNCIGKLFHCDSSSDSISKNTYFFYFIVNGIVLQVLPSRKSRTDSTRQSRWQKRSSTMKDRVHGAAQIHSGFLAVLFEVFQSNFREESVA